MTSSNNFPLYEPGDAYFQGVCGGANDAFIIKFESSTSVDEFEKERWVSVHTKGDRLIFIINASSINRFEITVYDADGRVHYGPLVKSVNRVKEVIEIPIRHSGVFFYEFKTSDKCFVGKALKLQQKL